MPRKRGASWARYCGVRAFTRRPWPPGARSARPQPKQRFPNRVAPGPRLNPLAAENEKLRRRNQRLEEELRKAQIVIDFQNKVARLLRQPVSGTPDRDP